LVIWAGSSQDQLRWIAIDSYQGINQIKITGQNAPDWNFKQGGGS